MQVTVIKNDHSGQEILRYTGTLVERDAQSVCLDAYFARDDVVTDYVVFGKGDRMREWFFADRWYNIFELHSTEDDRLKGWYCNVTRPAVLDGETISADDLALDVFITPKGEITVLDLDEFEALTLSDTEQAQALQAVESLKQQVQQRISPFDAISTDELNR